MEILQNLASYVLHIDKHLSLVIEQYGVWSYLFLFLVIFAETGLVITPFLPGDSLLFAAGTFAAVGSFHIVWLFGLIFCAAVIGDSVNYAVGKMLGQTLMEKYPRIVKKEYIERTQQFYAKYGGKTIVLARFAPIVRTFAPFIAGVGRMNYGYFFLYNVVGGFLWTAVFVLGGYFFGNTPMVKENFSVVILVIIVLSVIPAVVEFIKHRKR